MGDKTFELMEKMYVEFTRRFESLEAGQKGLEAGQKSLEMRQTKLEAILEHDIKEKLQALHERVLDNTIKIDGHTQQLDVINNKLDYLALAVNSQDKRLEIVESSRRKKAK